MFSDYNGMKLKTNNRRKFGKFTNMWKLKNTLLKNQWTKEKKITREIRKYFEINENEDTAYQTYRKQLKLIALKGIYFFKKDLKSII